MQTELDILKGKELVLASASPRRRELLSALGLPVRIAPVKEVDESFPADLAPDEVPEYISRVKAGAYVDELGENEILVTADTVVINHGHVMGKPHDAAEARKMLENLSGHAHAVVTGVTLLTTGGRHLSFSVKTDVEFAPLSGKEIDYYVDTFRPFDKAGAYGIQEWIGFVGVSGIIGDYYNVMGLPLHSLYQHLKELVGG